MIKILIAIVAIVVIFTIGSKFARRKRQKIFSEKFPIFKKLIADGKYDAALEILEKEPVFLWRCRLEPEQKKDVIELEIECLEKLHKIPEAVISLASHLSSAYKIGKWPSGLLSKWITLYKSCGPINVEKFYFCEYCGLHPETEALFKYAIEKENCKPPIGFPGKKSFSFVIKWSGSKFKGKENKNI